jgi:glycosyltransferase involved in cell wall biosynthesis
MKKVSIITVTLNSEATICKTIESVSGQLYLNKEHIIIDGSSTDRTVELVNSHIDKVSAFISEKDRGMYEAINKGINLASGDVIGILNSDDFFYDNGILDKIMNVFNNEAFDAVYGDVVFINKNDPSRVIRYYSSKRFNLWKFKYGYMPAHPSFYVKKSVLMEYGLYKDVYKLAGDFELMARLMYSCRISTKYLPFPFVVMRMGGLSNKSLRNIILKNREDLQACRENGIKSNILNIYLKYPFKIFEFVWRKQ